MNLCSFPICRQDIHLWSLLLSVYSGLSKWQFVFIFSTKSTQDICKYSGCTRGSTRELLHPLLLTKYYPKNHSRGHLIKVWIHLYTERKLAQTLGIISLWERTLGHMLSPLSEAWRKVKPSTERTDYTASLDKCWALSSLTRVFVRKRKAGEGNQSAGKVSWQNHCRRWEECKAEKLVPSPLHLPTPPAWRGCRNSHVSRQTSWHVTSQACGKCPGSQGSWNEACHFREKEEGED